MACYQVSVPSLFFRHLLRTIEIAAETLSDRVRQDKPPTKQMYKNVERVFVEHLSGPSKIGKTSSSFCRTGTDVAIAKDCQLQDIVLSQDSDLLAYDSLKTFWRLVDK